MEIVNIAFAPPGRSKLEEDASAEATGVVLLLHAGISEELLHDEDFFEKVKEPVRAQITGKPLAEQTMSLIMAESPEIKVDCTIRVEPPPAKIHWQDEELGPLDDRVRSDTVARKPIPPSQRRRGKRRTGWARTRCRTAAYLKARSRPARCSTQVSQYSSSGRAKVAGRSSRARMVGGAMSPVGAWNR
jgi:hypothetical protein